MISSIHSLDRFLSTWLDDHRPRMLLITIRKRLMNSLRRSYGPRVPRRRMHGMPLGSGHRTRICQPECGRIASMQYLRPSETD